MGDGFFNHLGWVNNYLPLSDAVLAVGILLTLLAIMLSVRIALWAGKKIHLLGGSE